MRRAALAAALLAAGPAGAEIAFPKGESYVIQLTSSQYSSGLGEYLVPPLERAFRKAGLRYEGGPGAVWVATVDPKYDVGAWYGTGAGREWLYTRTVTVGLSPASIDVEPEGRLSPAFSISARLLTPDADRVDELECLIALAVRELAVRYKSTGHVAVNGASCLRR